MPWKRSRGKPEDIKAIMEAIATFPKLFGLRSFPGKLFRMSPEASYVEKGVVILYTEVQTETRWSLFLRGNVSKLRTLVVRPSFHKIHRLAVKDTEAKNWVESLPASYRPTNK